MRVTPSLGAPWRPLAIAAIALLAPRDAWPRVGITRQVVMYVTDVEVIEGPEDGLPIEEGLWDEVLEVYVGGNADSLSVQSKRIRWDFQAVAE